MSPYKRTNITINIEKLKYNIQHSYDLCKAKSIDLAVVSKSICAAPEIIDAINNTCVSTIADSRLDNFQKIITDKTKMLIRPCTPYEVDDVVSLCDISFQTNLDTVAKLNEAAKRHAKLHKVLIMIDVGDMRDGIFFTDTNAIFKLAQFIHESDNLILAGVAANFNCFKGLLPDEETMGRLANASNLIRDMYDVDNPIVSGGTSSSISLLTKNNMNIPKEINQFRIGEAIMLGRDPSDNSFIEGYNIDVFTLNVPLLEIQNKPNDYPKEDYMLRGVLSVGKQDLMIEHIIPIDKRITLLGGCSDECVIDITNAPEYKVGDIISFQLEYGALMSAFARVFMDKIYQ